MLNLNLILKNKGEMIMSLFKKKEEKKSCCCQCSAVSYTHLDVYKRQYLNMLEENYDFKEQEMDMKMIR